MRDVVIRQKYLFHLESEQDRFIQQQKPKYIIQLTLLLRLIIKKNVQEKVHDVFKRAGVLVCFTSISAEEGTTEMKTKKGRKGGVKCYKYRTQASYTQLACLLNHFTIFMIQNFIRILRECVTLPGASFRSQIVGS